MMQRASQYIESLISSLRRGVQKAETPIKKKGGGVVDGPALKVTHADVFVAECFVGWQEQVSPRP